MRWGECPSTRMRLPPLPELGEEEDASAVFCGDSVEDRVSKLQPDHHACANSWIQEPGRY